MLASQLNNAMNLDQSSSLLEVDEIGISELNLTNFRNYESLHLKTNQGLVVLTGENGSGKTNVLEAISYLIAGRGLRSAKLSDVARKTANDSEMDEYSNNIIDFANPYKWIVNAKILKQGDEVTIGTGIEANQEYQNRVYDKRIVKINGEKVSNQSDLDNYMSLVWLTPQMDKLFRSSGTQARRNFLDRLVSAFDALHSKRIANYEHAYKQWVMLTSEGNLDDSWLSSLEEQMAEFGVAVGAARIEMVNRLNRFIEMEDDEYFPNVVIELNGYIESQLLRLAAVDVEEEFKNYLKHNRKNMQFKKMASIDGINKSDFRVRYKKKNMDAELCSTGEQKALLISIILAHAKSISLDRGYSVVLLLDEIAAHLDNIKLNALFDKLYDLRVQAFMTGTDISQFEYLKNKAQFLNVENSKINEVNF